MMYYKKMTTIPTKPVKAIALDLDGTIVDENLQISQRTLDVLKHLINDTDVRVVIATGRMFPSAIPFAQRVGVTTPLVTYQGAMVRDLDNGKNIHFHQPLDLKLAEHVLHYLLDNKYFVNLYMNDELWTNNDNRYTAYYTKASGITPILVEDLRTALTTAPTKLMVIDDERVPTLLGDLQALYGEQFGYCRSRSNFCEIIHPAASKWNALKILIDQWGIEADEVMAVGDQGNDISMISGAGLGVAMGGAPEDVVAVANYVTGSIEEDGVVQAIEKFVLN